VVIIERAVRNGKTEVQLIRFPSDLCSDHGRAINQGERGWESTLQGLPKELYDAWAKYFQPRGYKLRAEIVDFYRRQARRRRYDAELELSRFVHSTVPGALHTAVRMVLR
jgi:hypothetical protein